MNKEDKIFVAGHHGLVGAAILRNLQAKGYTNIITKPRSKINLTNQVEVEEFFQKENPDYVFLAAAKVGGIYANSISPADFAYENLMIECNVLMNSLKFKVRKLLFLGSSCIYPKNCPQPIKEEYLLSGYLEPTNEAYAIAKIAGLKMCQYFNKQYGTNFICAMPTNLYGPHDNFSLQSSHVLPALIRKIHEAKISDSPFVDVWGTGRPLREFMHVDDLADACLFLMENYNDNDFINVGTGEDITIADLADTIKKVVGYNGEINFDPAKPDGTFRKLLDVSRLEQLGWKHKILLEDGIRQTYGWFLENRDYLRS